MKNFRKKYLFLQPIKLLRIIKEVTLESVKNWISDRMTLHAAGLAFYTIFSLAPLLIIIIAVTGFIFGEQAATGQLSIYMEELMGPEMAQTIENFVLSITTSQGGILATSIGLATLLFAATTVITQLKDSLNLIWNVSTVEGKGFIQFAIDRFMAFLLILVLSGMLVSTIILDATITAIDGRYDIIIPQSANFWSWINTALFFSITTLLFAIIYKMLPNIIVKWSDVWVGALVTALLFMLGRWLIRYYFSTGIVSSTYGAAGGFVVFLIWVYYNAMVVFLGAEFTQIYTQRFGSKVETTRFARFTYPDADETEMD